MGDTPDISEMAELLRIKVIREYLDGDDIHKTLFNSLFRIYTGGLHIAHRAMIDKLLVILKTYEQGGVGETLYNDLYRLVRETTAGWETPA